MNKYIFPGIKKCLFFLVGLSAVQGLAEDIFMSTQPGTAVIDGKLQEKQWDTATKVGSFYKLNTNGEKANNQTEVRFWSNKKSLFIAYICHEKNINKIKAGLKKRDAAL